CPDATILLDFMLSRFTGMIEKLVVYPERMLKNLNMTHGVIFSQMVLLKMIDKGMSREDAYAVVQRLAMRSWEEGREFKTLLSEDDQAKNYLGPDELDAVFHTDNFLGKVAFIFKRVFGGE
ncbi:MAG: adenylosuccinate lyase, partial [Syntrophus sp. (in: bacteria)]